MKAVVMAGGAGSRLRPLTIQRPKPMVPIVNKPALGHILDLLKHHGFTEIVITVQYMAEFIQNFFGDGSHLGLKIHYSVENVPLGTAGSVKNAQHLLDETFIVISGDALTDFDLTKILDFHKSKRSLATITLYRVSDPTEYGVITLDNDGAITRFQEKPSRGSVMSDYVNTGIYVFEPEVLDYFSPNIPFDFAKDLFPLLQQHDRVIYGCVANGYWCDIGNISEYMRATSDALNGRINGLQLGHNLRDQIWVGRDVEISPQAHLEGPIYLGESVKIRDGVTIKGPTVIRDYSVIDNNARIDHSIFWRNSYIGEGVDVSGAIILRQCSLKARATVFEGAIVGDGTIVGAGAIIQPNVKIWPGKDIEARATINSSIIWGSQGKRELFGSNGVSGMTNVDMTPEFSARLGAAFGATLPKDSVVTINRDVYRSPRMIKRAIISGLPSAGINVWDLGSQSIPVARYYTGISKAAGGVHVQLSPTDPRIVEVQFMDEHGLELSENRRRDVQRVFSREDFRRVYLDDTGQIEYAQNVVETYTSDFLKHLDTKAIKEARFKLVVDYANAPAANVLPDILDKLDCNVVALNANIDNSRTSRSRTETQNSLKQMQIISNALGTQLGVCLDPGGEKIFVADDRGYLLEGITACAAMTDLALRDAPGSTVVIPVDLPSVFEEIAACHNGRILRTEIEPNALIKASLTHNVILAGNGKGNFILPDFQYAFDGMMALAKMLEFLATQRLSLSEVVSSLPPYHIARRKVPCNWDVKATVMRLINERFQEYKTQSVNGVKIDFAKTKWILIIPDPNYPHFLITAEGTSRQEAEALADEYAQIVGEMCPVI